MTHGQPSLIPTLVIPILGIFWLWMFWEMTKNDQLTDQEKSNWTLAFILLNIFTAIVYFVQVYRSKG